MYMKVVEKKITENYICLDVNPKFRDQEKRTGIALHAWLHFESVNTGTSL